MKKPENEPQDPLLEERNFVPEGDFPPEELRKSVLASLLLLDQPTKEAPNQTNLRAIANRCLIAFLLGVVIGGQGEVPDVFGLGLNL